MDCAAADRSGRGSPKASLTRGEHKSIQTDRVVLVPGPPEEVETVRWMYRSFVKEGKLEREIADILNERGHHDRSRPAMDARHRPSGPDQREIHRQQCLEPRLVQAEEESVSATAPTCGFAPTEHSSPSLTGRCSTPHRRSSASGRASSQMTKCSRPSSELLQDRGYLSGLIIDETERSAVQQRLSKPLRKSAARLRTGRLHAGSRLSLHRDQSRAPPHAPAHRGRRSQGSNRPAARSEQDPPPIF